MKLILMGPPGSGKGTQAELLAREYGLAAVSTGNMLREAIAAGTELGRTAARYMDGGNLVPDDIVVSIVRDRLSRPDVCAGFILDGYPRTLSQAEALDGIGISIDAAVFLEIPDTEIERRMAGRRVCLKCGATYHVEHRPPEREGICGHCGDPLVQRVDDAPETVRERLRVYHAQAGTVKTFYEKAGTLVDVPASGSVDEVFGRVKALLEVNR